MKKRNWSGWFPLALVALAYGASAFAQEGGEAAAKAVRADLSEKVKMAIAIAVGFGMAIASFGGVLGQSRAVSAAVDGIARNPGAAGKIFAPALIVGLALMESLVLLTFVVAFLLQGNL